MTSGTHTVSSRPRATVALLALAALLGGAASPAHGKPGEGSPPRVRLVVSGCADTLSRDVRRHLAVELGDLLVDAIDSRPDEQTGASLICIDGEIDLRVDDPLTGKTLLRHLKPPVDDAVRARILALAVAELIAASWSELLANPSPVATSEASPARRRAALDLVEQRSERPRPWRLRVLAQGSLMGSFRGAEALGIAGVRVDGDHPRGFAWTLELSGGHGSPGTSLGTVNIDALVVATSLGYLRMWPRVGLRAAVGLRAGELWIEGAPVSTLAGAPLKFHAPFCAPLANLEVLVRPVRHFVLALGLEAGYLTQTVGVLIGSTREISMSGVLLTGTLAVGVEL